MSTPLTRRSFLGAALRATAGIAFAPHLGYPSILGGVTDGVAVVRACHTMGSTLRITALAESRPHGISAISAAFAEVDRLDRLLSVYRNQSAVSKINRNAGRRAVQVDDDVLAAIDYGRVFSSELPGAFDVTLEPLMRSWGFREGWRRQDAPPSDIELVRMLDAVGPDMIELDMAERTVGLRKTASAIDLGGIGVGFALDRAVRVLYQHGIENAFINHSGDAYALGRPTDSDGWPIGIPDPRKPGHLCLSLALSNRAVSTSGSYENRIRRGERTYGHLLSPRTGIPVETHLSVTVIANSSLEADVLSTAAFCSDPSGMTDKFAEVRRAEIIGLDRSEAGELLYTHSVPLGMLRTSVRVLEAD